MCSVLRFFQSYFLVVNRVNNKNENVTCRVRCSIHDADDGQSPSLPSFTTITVSIDKIVSLLNATGVFEFPVDVSYDFERREWIENNNQMAIQLPWVSKPNKYGVTYPIMNDRLIASSTLSRGYTTMSSTHAPVSNHKLGFYCVNPRLKMLSELQTPMIYVDAIKTCTDKFNNSFILTQTWQKQQIIPETWLTTQHYEPGQPEVNNIWTTFLWTGSLRHNTSHFRREDGVLFEPLDFAGTHRDFYATVLISITNGTRTLEARNTLSDKSDYCLCYINVSLSRLFKHQYFSYTVSGIALLICFISYCIVHFRQ